MEVMTTYKVKIKESHGALKATVNLYRQAVDFFIDVSIKEWDMVEKIEQLLKKQRVIECLVHYTRTNNICARYFIREILKSLSERERFGMEAKVPACSNRTICTLAILISLNA